MKKMLSAALLIILITGALSAQDANEAPENDFTDETTIILDDTAAAENEGVDQADSFFTTWDFIKVILILVAVIVVIYAIFYGLKKAGGLKYQNDELIKLLGSQSLTQSGSVHLIEVGAKYYLVGCGDASVNLIADVDDKESVDEILLKKPAGVEKAGSFMELFNQKLGLKNRNSSNLKEKIQNNNKFMHDQAERLKKM